MNTTSIALKMPIGAAITWMAAVALGGISPTHGLAQQKKHEYRCKDVPVTITLEDVTLEVRDRRQNKPAKSFNLGQGKVALPRLLPLKQKAIDLTPSTGKYYEAAVTGVAANTGKRPVSVVIFMLPVRRSHPKDEIGEWFDAARIRHHWFSIDPGTEGEFIKSVEGVVQVGGIPDADGYRQYFRVAIQAFNSDDPVEAGISNVMSATTGPFVVKPRRANVSKLSLKPAGPVADLWRNTAAVASHGAGSPCGTPLEDAAQDRDAELKPLLKERSELLVKSVRQLTLLYRIAYASWGQLATVQRQALDAALDSADGRKARLAQLRELKDNAEGAFKVAEARFTAGVAPEYQMLQARAMLLEARVAILKEEAKKRP